MSPDPQHLYLDVIELNYQLLMDDHTIELIEPIDDPTYRCLYCGDSTTAECHVRKATKDVPALISRIRELEASRTLEYKLVAEEKIRLQKARISELEDALDSVVASRHFCHSWCESGGDEGVALDASLEWAARVLRGQQ
jgi:hypothetical protein